MSAFRTFLYASRGAGRVAVLAERQRVSRHNASLVNTFTNYDDVKGAIVKNSHRVRVVTQRMSGFPNGRPGDATVRYLR